MSTGAGMSDYTDFISQIKEWSNREDWSDNLAASFVAMANQKFNAELRVDRMIAFSSNTVTLRCSTLPDDWLQMDLVKIENANGADGYLPIRYKARDEFFNLTDDWSYGYYTIEGRTIYFGGPPDETEGVKFTIAYYGEVPAFADTGTSWLYTKFPSLYLNAALYHAALHAVGEEQSAANFKTLAEDEIQKLNALHLRSKASGSRMTRSRVRSFG
jgi:hypothetical protein